MASSLLLSALLLCTLCLASGQQSFPAHPPAGSEISSLPGFSGTLPSRQFGGYVNISGGTKHFYYYLATSTANPSTAPLVLWLNGGPGCSSMTGWGQEIGPFSLGLQFASPGNATTPVTGVNLTQNPYAFNAVANMLFIDNPVGTGLSYSDNPDDDYSTNDTQTQSDLYAVMQAFFKLWPDFQASDFYISGESYAGVYIPMLASAIVQGNAAGASPAINIKGYIEGNPATDSNTDDTEAASLYQYWGLLPPSIVQPLQSCGTQNSDFGFGATQNAANGESCEDVQDNINNITTGVYTYNYQSDCFWAMADFQTQLYNSLQTQWAAKNVTYNEDYYGDDPSDTSCYSDDRDYTLYLNTAAVRNAIHAAPVPSGAGMFISCTNRVDYSYDVTDVVSYHQSNLQAGLRVAFFSGTLDSVVPWLGTYSAVQTLSQGRTAQLGWQAWSYPDASAYGSQVAGFIQTWDQLAFITFKDAGHEVALYVPQEAQIMFQAFLANQLNGLTASTIEYPVVEFNASLT